LVEPHHNFGDGVNAAVRLEALAEPGGVCTRTRCATGASLPMRDLGERQAKNIARPVRVYALCSEGIAGTPTARI
jgi:adenylate cyclase